MDHRQSVALLIGLQTIAAACVECPQYAAPAIEHVT
jgi:hypothetical protein